MVKKRLVGLFILFICLSAIGFAQDCVRPRVGLVIDEDTTLCRGIYKMDEGLAVAADNVEITCEGTTIRGYDNEEAFSIVNREDVTIKNCNIENFQIGVRVTNSDKVRLENNLINDNRVGIYLTESNENVFNQNRMENNTNYAVFLDNKSKVNTFRNNTIADTAFNVQRAEDAPYNNYEQNEYIQVNGPSNYSTSYVIEEEDKQPKKDVKTGVESIPEEKYFQGEEISDRELLQKVYEAREIDSSDYIERDLEQIEETGKNIDSSLNVIVDYDENTTTFERSYTFKKDMQNVAIYEYIPKSIASQVEEMDFEKKDFVVLENDPLIMWKYEDVQAGQTVEKSYKVNEVVKKEEKPKGTVCVDCTKKKASYSFVIPLLLIPVIVFGFIIFDRMQKKPE